MYKYKSNPEAGLPLSMLRDEKFQRQLVLELEGMTIMCNVSHSKGTYKDKPITNANVDQIEPIGSSASTTKKSASDIDAPGKGEEKESGW